MRQPRICEGRVRRALLACRWWAGGGVRGGVAAHETPYGSAMLHCSASGAPASAACFSDAAGASSTEVQKAIVMNGGCGFDLPPAPAPAPATPAPSGSTGGVTPAFPVGGGRRRVSRGWGVGQAGSNLLSVEGGLSSPRSPRGWRVAGLAHSTAPRTGSRRRSPARRANSRTGSCAAAPAAASRAAAARPPWPSRAPWRFRRPRRHGRRRGRGRGPAAARRAARSGAAPSVARTREARRCAAGTCARPRGERRGRGGGDTREEDASTGGGRVLRSGEGCGGEGRRRGEG